MLVELIDDERLVILFQDAGIGVKPKTIYGNRSRLLRRISPHAVSVYQHARSSDH